MESPIVPHGRASWREVVVCTLALLAVGAVLFGPHISDGGRYSDDWALAAKLHFDAGDELGMATTVVMDDVGGRPLNAIYLSAAGTLLDDQLAAQHAIQVVLAGLACLLFFVVLRTVGLPVGWAASAAVLSFIFPWADSTRLWAVTAPNQLCVILYFCGVLAALRGLRSEAPRGWAWHAVAVGAYLLSLLFYEAAAVAIILTGLLYVAVAGWDRGRTRWAVDVAVIVPAAAILLSLTRAARSTPGIESILAGISHLPDQATRLLLEAFVPVSASTAARSGIVAFMALLIACAVLRLRRSSDPLARPFLLIAAALIAVVAAWIPFLGAELWPASPGLDNRGNLAAAFGIALLVVAVGRMIAVLISATAGRSSVGNVAAVIFIAAVGAGWAVTAREHVQDYDRAAESQERLLAELEAAIPSPLANSTIYVLGQAAQTAEGVPIFSEAWDLRGAVRLQWDDPSLSAFPIVGIARLDCSESSVVPRSPRLQAVAVLESGLSLRNAAPYGRAYAYDAGAKRAIRIGDRRSCERVVETMPAGEIIEG